MNKENKIYLYVINSNNNYMSSWANFHFVKELESSGDKFITINISEDITKGDYKKKIEYLAKKGLFDILITVLNEDYIDANLLWDLRQYKIRTLLVCFDNLTIPYRHIDIAKHYDLVWLLSQETQDKFIRSGANTIFLPYAANPYMKPSFINNRIPSIAFIGNPYGSRINILNALVSAELPVTVRDPLAIAQDTTNIKHVNLLPKLKAATQLLRFAIGRKVLWSSALQKIKKTKLYQAKNLEILPGAPIEELANLYSMYSLILSTTSARNTDILSCPVPVVHLKVFEIAMSMGLQICRRTAELEGYFLENHEIIFYDSRDELIDKVRFYINNADKTNTKLYFNARQRCLNEHTWIHRFNKITIALSKT